MKRRKLTVDERHELAAKYLPTPAEIAAACLAMQAEWSEAEKARRRGQIVEPWDVPVVRSEGEW